MPQWRPAMWRGFRMPIEKGGRAANARERSLRQRHVRAAANGVGGNVAHPGKAIRRADEEGERRAFRQTTTGVGGPHRGVRRARPARGIAHVDGTLPAGREPGDGAQRASRCWRTAATSRSRTRRQGASPPTPATAPSSTTCWSSGLARRRARATGAVVDELRRSATELDALLERTSAALARLTDCLSIVLAPSVLTLRIKPDLAHIAVLLPGARRAGDRGRPGVQPPDGLRRGSGPRRAGAGAEVRGRSVHGQDAAARWRAGWGAAWPRPSATRWCGWCWTRCCPACRKASWAARTGWA